VHITLHHTVYIPDAVRAVTGLPVYDAISCCDFFTSGLRDNDRFGMDEWQDKWDGEQEMYNFGQELSLRSRHSLQSRFSIAGANRIAGTELQSLAP